jgi:DNA mismatch endonuclease Vsr
MDDVPIIKPGRPVFDNVTDGRRENMRRIKSKDTKPEMAVRSLLHALGYRYRLHRRDLPGKPDIVFPSRRKVVEVRGCYWHFHGCERSRMPSTRADYWGPKIAGNKERDTRNITQLKAMGWDVLEIWECGVRASLDQTARELVCFLES